MGNAVAADKTLAKTSMNSKLQNFVIAFRPGSAFNDVDLGSLSSCTLQGGQQSLVDFVGSDALLCRRLSSQSLQSERAVIELLSKVRYREDTDLLL